MGIRAGDIQNLLGLAFFCTIAVEISATTTSKTKGIPSVSSSHHHVARWQTQTINKPTKKRYDVDTTKNELA
jgi:hypothetical protein